MTDDRVMLDDIQVVLQTEYVNSPDDHQEAIELDPGREPFVVFKMRQQDGAIVLDVTASLVTGEEELIETLEVFFDTMLQDRAIRQAAELEAELLGLDGVDE